MKGKHLCFTCAFWIDKIQHPLPGYEIIDGNLYKFNGWDNTREIPDEMRTDSYYIVHNDSTTRRSNRVQYLGHVPDRFRDRLPDTGRFVTVRAYYRLKDFPFFQCEKKGCWDRYHCHFFNVEEMEKNGAWNEVPSNYKIGSEGCEVFLDKTKVYIK